MNDEMDEIWVLFADDGAQAIDAMESALLALQDADPDQVASHVAALFRGVHTFKGNSRVLGLGVVESRAHLAEDLIGLVRDDGIPLDDEILDLLIETSDRLRDMLDMVAAARTDVDPEATEDLVRRLKDKIARCSPGDAEAADIREAPPAVEPPAALPALDMTDLMARLSDPAPGAIRGDDPVSPAVDTGPQEEEPQAQDVAPVDAAPEASAGTRLADDPGYRSIFDGMAAEAIDKMRACLASGDMAAARVQCDNLDHAASHLGLQEWCDVLRAGSAALDATSLSQLIDTLVQLSSAQAPTRATAAPELSEGFFARLREPLATIAKLGIDFTTGERPDPETLQTAVLTVAGTADGEGFVRVSAASHPLLAVRTAADYRRAELRLFEELALVEAVYGDEGLGAGLSPAALLANWAADHIFDTLDELDATLERLRQPGERDTDEDHQSLGRLVRLVHHACRHYRLETASQLAMSLLDLFERGHACGQAPDAILMRIARGFIDTLELVFDALRAGEKPDTDRLEQLFAEASEAGFSGAGVMTAAAIERKLGLPTEFHRVLSPESTRAAAEALKAGLDFYILRADVNSDNDLAEALFGLIGAGTIQAITNVTLFRGQETLFDFLIATALDQLGLSETLARLDPGGRRLELIRHLTVEEPEAGVEPTEGEREQWSQMSSGVDLSAGTLERIGEIAAGQAMIHGIISELADSDLPETINAILRHHRGDPREAAAALRGVAEEMMTRLRDLAQLETQLLGQMAELQQTTAELRSRPIESLLRPMAAMVATESRMKGHEAHLTTSGEGMALDIALLDSLKRVLRPLVMARLASPDQAPRRLHLTVRRSDDQLLVALEDDGGTRSDRDRMETAETELTRAGGTLRAVPLPGGGQRHHLNLPMNLIVLEGMVVGAGGTRYVLPVEAIRTILQPDPAALIDVSVGGGQRWLRLSKDEVVAIRSLGANVPAQGEEDGQRMSKVHVILGHDGTSIAIPVDDLVGQQLVLLRPLRGLMSRLRNVTGVALLSGGDVGMVLSPRSLLGTRETVEGGLSLGAA